jgi:hypothetical protein
MVRLLLTWLVGCAAVAAPVSGRVTDGTSGLAGVRVYPDRLVRVRSRDLPPVAVTDAEGRFTLELDPGDTVLAVEKSGWARDLVPLAELAGAAVALRPAPEYRREAVLAVRLEFPGGAPLRSDAELRSILFSRRPGEASAANYYYEISKGSLELEEGALIHLADPDPPRPLDDTVRVKLVKQVLEELRGQLGDAGLAAYDRVDDRTGALGPDGKPDHLWLIPPGPSRTVTLDPAHFSAITYMMPLPWKRGALWPVVFFSEETPLGNLVHEGIHAMGEQKAGDLYMDLRHPMTAGRWDIMDAGQFQGWDLEHTTGFPWQEDSGYSPAQPMGWVRAELWYRGRFRATVPEQRVAGSWEGWLEPLARAPHGLPQRLLVPDPRRRGAFWELAVRRPWGFDRGRTGNRWGPGFEGLVVAWVDPARNVPGLFLGPVRVVDAHPGTPAPPQPRYPGGRWQLDDAAFNLGPGEVAAGRSGPLSWEVLATDPSGRMRVRVRLGSGPAKATPRKDM